MASVIDLVMGGCTSTDTGDAAATEGPPPVQEARVVAIDYSYPVAPAQLEEGLDRVGAGHTG